jgi:xylulokinase
LTYDLKTQDWSPARVAEYKIGPSFLPKVQPWPSIIANVRREVSEDWGIPPQTVLALGGHDVNCAAIGAGVSQLGVACLISGSYENLLVTTGKPPTPNMLLRGLSVMPHPGSGGFIALAVCPTGNAVLNWARELLDLSIDEGEKQIAERALGPGPILAVPYLSGSMAFWEDGRKARGALFGLTLATTSTDILQALMESIAYDHVNTFALLKEEGVNVNRIRAVGGGSRSRWWTQLKADLTELPIEVVEAQEAGTLGAAILAGVATGVFKDLEEVSQRFSGTSRIHTPDPTRANLHRERLEVYRKTVPNLISNVYAHWV